METQRFTYHESGYQSLTIVKNHLYDYFYFIKYKKNRRKTVYPSLFELKNKYSTILVTLNEGLYVVADVQLSRLGHDDGIL